MTLLFLLLSCGAVSHSGPGNSSLPNPQADICNCTPTEPDTVDFRHAEKHVPLPQETPQEISVATILSWPPSPVANNTPRQGRELQLFHVAHAWLQAAFVNRGDCDLHAEISDVPDPKAPRVIVEIPSDSGYCDARTSLQAALAQRGFTLTNTLGVGLPQAIPVEVTGLAFQDFQHRRGSQFVATDWELHPAVVNVLQQ